MKTANYKYLILLFVALLPLYSAIAQNTVEFKEIEKQIQDGNYPLAKKNLKKIAVSHLSKPSLAVHYHLQGSLKLKENDEDGAYHDLIKARQLYLAVDSTNKAMEVNLEIAHMVSSQENNKNKYYKYLKEYFNYAIKSEDPLLRAEALTEMGIFKMDEADYKSSMAYFKSAITALKGSNREYAARINSNISALYSQYMDKPDSALYYLSIDTKYLKENHKHKELLYNYVNQAAAYNAMGRYKEAISYLKMAEKIPIKGYEAKTRQYLFEFLYKNYEAIGDYENAYRYVIANKAIADSLNSTEQNIAINDIQTKYQTKEKELENTKLKNNIETNRILLYTSIGILLAVAAIALLLVKNARRKEKISKQEKLIEQQKLEKALKDYEINSIDMMLEGQEKERQRIANDLHDNLGSMLATLKLNFENLKLRKSELRDEETKLYERTDELIEEAYQKVRRLAHAKNAGVLATEGLIPAIKKLAEKISIPGKLQMQVVPFGFNDRLDNTIEIMIFRAVQELGTNIIKHSQATEATIHLTHHDDIINIIIEDNGIGFKSSELQMNDGMGLQAIRKKIEQLGGTFTIDSMPGKGTTILIDIPV